MTDKKKILWVDDDQNFCDMALFGLNNIGSFTCVNRFNEASKKHDIKSYDLVLIDGDLAGYGEGFKTGESGPDLLLQFQNIAKTDGFELPPVIFITSDVKKTENRLKTLNILSDDTPILYKGKYHPNEWRTLFKSKMNLEL